ADFTATQVIGALNFQNWLSDNLNDLRFRHGFLREEVDATNTATLQNLPGMSFPVKAGETWAWFSFQYFVSTVLGDIAFGASAPQNSTGRYGLVGPDNPISPGSTSTFGDPVKMVVGNTDEKCANFNGLIIASADGTVQMQMAQAAASSGETATARQDSWFVAFRL
ncbi:MAG: hypothetical protein L0241_32705, partial [Planctomycetia bacterium]|nr:hypothetical protein [Planctomycetia bacterium]